MIPTVPSSTNNISLTPRTFFTRRPNNFLTRSSNSQRSAKSIVFCQTHILPLSTSFRLFPQFRNEYNFLSKSRTYIASATGTDKVVQEQGSPIADAGTVTVLSDAGETTENLTVKSDSASTPVRSKRSKPNRKSDMPPVKDEELVPGASFTGKVKSIQPFGAFVDFGAFTDGLVHVSRLSDSFVKDVGSVVSVGQEVEVRLVEVNTDTGRISLTMRESDDTTKLQQLQDATVNNDKSKSPRRNTGKPTFKKDEVKKSSKFVKGQELEGMVKNMTRSGAFISLPEGEEGFLPLAEESDDPFASIMGNSSLQVGQKVNVRVLRVARVQVTLTMKKEDAGDVDSGLRQGVVYTATNPFVLAFRQNEDIASFLEEREKQESLVDSSRIPEPSDEAKLKFDETVNELATALVEDKSISINEDLVSEPSVGNNDLDTSEVQVSSSEKLTNNTSSTDETVGDVENSTKEVKIVDSAENDGADKSLQRIISESLPTEESSSPTVEKIEVSPAINEVEMSKQTDNQISPSESILSEDVVESQAFIDVAGSEVQVEISNTEGETSSHFSVEEEKASPDQEENGSVTHEKLDECPPDSTTDGEQITVEAATNQSDDAKFNDESLPQTFDMESSNPSAAAPDGSATKSNGESSVSLQQEYIPKATISPALVKQLREETGAGMMVCKKALSESGGDIIKAQEYLRKKGLASAEKKASRATAEGRIGSYIHDSRIGVLVEVNCETDFVSRGDIFKGLVDDIAMQVAACPQVQYLVTENVPQEFVDKEKEIEMQKEDLSSKPEQIRSKIVEGRIRKRLGELALLEQPYIKDDKVVVKDLIKQTIATIGENIQVTRFVRYNLGEGLEKRSQDFAAEVAAQTAAKPVSPGVKEQPAVTETKETIGAPSKVAVSAALVKQLREQTGAGMMDCKRALSETGGDLEKAQEYLRKKGLSAADKKSSRLAAEGRIGSYIHDSRIGVLIEVNCETDFVGRSENFKELVDDLAMQVAANPQVQYVSVEEIPEGIVNKEKELESQREDILSKPENIREKIVDGRVSKRLGELALLEQPFIKNDSILVKDLVKQTIASIGENIKVRRFVRFTLGEASDATTDS